jgi:hypothetical protein
MLRAEVDLSELCLADPGNAVLLAQRIGLVASDYGRIGQGRAAGGMRHAHPLATHPVDQSSH